MGSEMCIRDRSEKVRLVSVSGEDRGQRGLLMRCHQAWRGSWTGNPMASQPGEYMLCSRAWSRFVAPCPQGGRLEPPSPTPGSRPRETLGKRAVWTAKSHGARISTKAPPAGRNGRAVGVVGSAWGFAPAVCPGRRLGPLVFGPHQHAKSPAQRRPSAAAPCPHCSDALLRPSRA